MVEIEARKCVLAGKDPTRGRGAGQAFAYLMIRLRSVPSTELTSAQYLPYQSGNDHEDLRLK